MQKFPEFSIFSENFSKILKIQLAHFVDLAKCCKMSIWLQKSVLIQPRTSLGKSDVSWRDSLHAPQASSARPRSAAPTRRSACRRPRRAAESGEASRPPRSSTPPATQSRETLSAIRRPVQRNATKVLLRSTTHRHTCTVDH